MWAFPGLAFASGKQHASLSKTQLPLSGNSGECVSLHLLRDAADNRWSEVIWSLGSRLHRQSMFPAEGRPMCINNQSSGQLLRKGKLKGYLWESIPGERLGEYPRNAYGNASEVTCENTYKKTCGKACRKPYENASKNSCGKTCEKPFFLREQLYVGSHTKKQCPSPSS